MQMIPDWAGYLKHRPAIAAIIDERRHPLAWLDEQILLGEFRVWLGDNSIIIAGLKTWPSGARDVEGIVAAGDATEIVALIPLAEQWGREQGCIGALIESRDGWARVMKPHGYAPYQTTIRKEL